MTSRKEVVVVFLIFIFFSLQFVLSLGISPGKQSVDFSPNLELEYTFRVLTGPTQEVELYALGDLAEFVEFDKKGFVGGGNFNVKIKLPSQIEKPGDHILLIGVREKVDDEGDIGGSVAVQSPIVISVPYPGKYAEISFDVSNVNVGEEINLEVYVESKGKEPIDTSTTVEVYDFEGKKIKNLNLGSFVINNQESYVFEGNTNIDNPGSYKAIAIVNYQAGIARAESNFRVGYLFVNITSYTSKVIKKGIQPFIIGIENLWNDPLDNVFAEVYISKNGENVTDFLTPSSSLFKWEKKSLIGYLDTEKLDIGEYDSKIVLKYGNLTDVDDLTIVEGKLKVVKEKNYLIYILVFVAALIILIFIYFKFRKKK